MFSVLVLSMISSLYSLNKIYSTSSTFLCMSITKVILNWRLDIYMRLNSSITINLASMCAIILILFDLMIRINMHIYDNCEDNLAFVGYQIEFQRQFCVPKIHNLSDNMTLWEIYNQAENVYPIGCVKCPSYLTLRILGACVLFYGKYQILIRIPENC